jgi:hypothetical protein
MTQLKLILDNSHSWPLMEVSAIVNIYDITTDRIKKQNQANLLLQNNRLYTDIDPGKYIIELRPPSGRLIRKEIDIQDQHSMDVALDLENPHEWLWLQTLYGNIKDKKTYDAHKTDVDTQRGLIAPSKPKTWVLATKPLADQSQSIYGSDGAEIKEGYFLLYPQLQKQNRYDREKTLLPSVAGIYQQTRPIQIQPSMEDSLSQLFDLKPSWVMHYLNPKPPIDGLYQSNDFQRSYLWTEFPGFPPQYSVLPIPWQQTAGDQFNSVQIYLNINPDEKRSHNNYDTLHRVAIAVEDEFFSSMIGYLGSGDLPSASTIVNQAKEILMYKVHNPFAAAAGAYILLEQTETNRDYEWHDWIQNLMNWFKWLPDGAIQWAWLQLAKSPENETGDYLQDNLIKAYERGLPYYSVGVRMLLNCLTVFDQRLKANGQKDEYVEHALNNVRKLSVRTNRRQPFTSVIAG